jgi:hypothetical protein
MLRAHISTAIEDCGGNEFRTSRQAIAEMVFEGSNLRIYNVFDFCKVDSWLTCLNGGEPCSRESPNNCTKLECWICSHR